MPKGKPISKDEAKEAVDALHEHGSHRKAAAFLGCTHSTLQNRLAQAVKLFGDDVLMAPTPRLEGRAHELPTAITELPKRGKVDRYLFTSAQNNTSVHPDWWQNLEAYAGHYNAEIKCSTFTYNKLAFGARSVKRGSEPTPKDKAALGWDPLVMPYLSDERIQVAPGLVWCGELQLLPTIRRPLVGFETYTGRSSTILPHASIAMCSVPSLKHEGTKLMYTTGASTMRNYIQRKLGLQAEPQHAFGALIVEVDDRGCWYCRQLSLGPDNAVYDLNLRAKDGKITEGNWVESITWGDLHGARVDPRVAKLAWEPGGMLDVLRPNLQFLHDVLDFNTRGHHTRRNSDEMFKLYVNGKDNVAQELVTTAQRVIAAEREWCDTVVVDSNHDHHMNRWLRESSFREDPANAIAFLELALAKYQAIAAGNDSFHLLEHAMRSRGVGDSVRFLRQDESHVILPQIDGGIEGGLHGDLGPNGSRGGIMSLSRLGRRANIGHSHSAGIHDGIWQAGTSSLLDMGFNIGPGSWSASHIVTYKNSTRSMVTMWGDKWRA